MTITVNTPDGGTAQFPDDTPQDAIVGAMKAKFGGPDAAPASDSKPWLSLTGTDKVGEFVGKMSDAFTGGFGAKALDAAGIGQGPGGQTVAKQVEAAGQDIGPVGSALADVAGYALGPGKLGLAARGTKIAEGLGAGSRLATGLGAAGEAAGATAAGDIGHGETPGMDVLYAGGLGGSLGAAAGKAAAKPVVGRSLQDLQTAADASFDNLAKIKVGNNTVAQAFDSARSSLRPGQQSGISSQMQNKIDDVDKLITNNPSLTMQDVFDYRKNINNAAVSNEDRVLAKRVGDSLQNLSPALEDASIAHGQVRDAIWLANADPSAAVAKAAQNIRPNAQVAMDPAGLAAMRNLANAGPQGPIGKGLSWLGDTAQEVLGNKAATATAGAIGGGLGGGIIGGTIGATTAPIVGALAKSGIGLLRQNKIKRAIKAARAATSTGQLATPDMYARMPTVYRNALPFLNAGGAAGAYGGAGSS